MTRFSTWLSPLAVAMACSIALRASPVRSWQDEQQSDPALREISEQFSNDRFDSSLWRIDAPGTKIEFVNESMQFQMPAGPVDRSPARFAGRFRLSGDFEIECDITINSFSNPGGEFLSTELFLDGEPGTAALGRMFHAEKGNGIVRWSTPRASVDADETSPESESAMYGFHRFLPEKCRVRLTRRGDQLEFFATTSRGEMRRIDTSQWGTGDVDKVEFRLIGTPRERTSTHIAFDNIHVKADEIVPITRVQPQVSGRSVWGALAGVFATIAGVGLVWIARQRLID